jgi:hypothetical protein
VNGISSSEETSSLLSRLAGSAPKASAETMTGGGDDVTIGDTDSSLVLIGV